MSRGAGVGMMEHAMASTVQFLLALVAGASVIGTAAAQTPPSQGGRKFTTTLNGAQECNAAGAGNLGDPNGTGTAHVTVNIGQQRVCWDITVSNISAPQRAHIHRGPAGGAGGIAVGFFEAADPDLVGCTPTTQPVDRALLREILQHPERFYVNIHTADFTAGAIRGQLGK